MDWKGFADRHQRQFDSKYEREFVLKVLARVSGLSPDAVSVQRIVRDTEGKTRRIDFTVEEGDHVRIALEVDGYDKTGRGSGMTISEFIEWSKREQAITALGGYRVLRFANSLVRHQPEGCARNVELTLDAERALAQRLETAEQERDELRRRLDESRTRLTQLGSDLAAAQQAGDEKRAESAAADIDRADAAHRAVAEELLEPAERQELEKLEDARKGAASTADDELRTELDALRRETRGMKTIAVSAAVIVAAVVILAIALSNGGDGDNSGGRGTGGAPVAGPCKGAVAWSEASLHVGEQARVRGPVVDARYAASTRGRPTYLNVGKPFPDASRFVVVIFGDDRSKFSRPESTFAGKDILANGEVSTFKGTAQIKADDPSDITIC